MRSVTWNRFPIKTFAIVRLDSIQSLGGK